MDGDVDGNWLDHETNSRQWQEKCPIVQKRWPEGLEDEEKKKHRRCMLLLLLLYPVDRLSGPFHWWKSTFVSQTKEVKWCETLV